MDQLSGFVVNGHGAQWILGIMLTAILGAMVLMITEVQSMKRDANDVERALGDEVKQLERTQDRHDEQINRLREFHVTAP